MTGRSGPIDRTLALSVRSRDSRHVSPASNAVRQISTVAKLTGRSGKTDRTLKPQRPVVSSKLPEACFFDRTRPVHLDRTQTASGAQPLATVPPSQRDRTQADSVRCFWIQRPVTGPTPASFRSTPFQLLLLHPCSSVPTTKNFASGAIENRHFIFPKAPNEREGPKPISTLQTPCAHVLAYFHKYFQGC